MFDENALITTIPKSQPVSSSRCMSTTKTLIEPVLESYEILRCDARRHAQQRKEFYTKAHQANRHGMSGVVSFYIHRASEQTQLMKDANRAACERLSRWRLTQFYQTQRLDLHGLHSDEALNLFKRMEQEFNEGHRKTTPKSMEIITGYGKNSVYGGSHGKIRSVILAYLQQRNYK
jgi:DNA-nicking Smr family endonuclease